MEYFAVLEYPPQHQLPVCGSRRKLRLQAMSATPSRKSNWKQDPERVKSDILHTATEVFAARGLSGARVDEIVRKTNTSKRMLYYYFGDKNGLYLSVLEAAYARLRSGESELNLEKLKPMAALRQLVGFTFEYHRDNPAYVRLIQVENIHHAENLERSERIAQLNLSAIDNIKKLCARGIESGQFKADITPVQLHWLITSACFFNVSNSATFQHLYGDELYTDDGQIALKNLVINTVVAAVRS